MPELEVSNLTREDIPTEQNVTSQLSVSGPPANSAKLSIAKDGALVRLLHNINGEPPKFYQGSSQNTCTTAGSVVALKATPAGLEKYENLVKDLQKDGSAQLTFNVSGQPQSITVRADELKGSTRLSAEKISQITQDALTKAVTKYTIEKTYGDELKSVQFDKNGTKTTIELKNGRRIFFKGIYADQTIVTMKALSGEDPQIDYRCFDQSNFNNDHQVFAETAFNKITTINPDLKVTNPQSAKEIIQNKEQQCGESKVISLSLNEAQECGFNTGNPDGAMLAHVLLPRNDSHAKHCMNVAGTVEIGGKEYVVFNNTWENSELILMDKATFLKNLQEINAEKGSLGVDGHDFSNIRLRWKLEGVPLPTIEQGIYKVTYAPEDFPVLYSKPKEENLYFDAPAKKEDDDVISYTVTNENDNNVEITDELSTAEWLRWKESQESNSD